MRRRKDEGRNRRVKGEREVGEGGQLGHLMSTAFKQRSHFYNQQALKILRWARDLGDGALDRHIAYRTCHGPAKSNTRCLSFVCLVLYPVRPCLFFHYYYFPHLISCAVPSSSSSSSLFFSRTQSREGIARKNWVPGNYGVCTGYIKNNKMDGGDFLVPAFHIFPWRDKMGLHLGWHW